MKLITVNIEGDRHLSRVFPFIHRENPDVLCVQEIFEDTASKIALLGYVHMFLSMTLKEGAEADRAWGAALFVRNTFSPTFSSALYHTNPGGLKRFDREHQEDTVSRGIVFGNFVRDNVVYRIATTHFTWTKDGEHASPAQIAHMDSLLAIMAKEPPHLLCGDFNIPRGHNPLYHNLTTIYTDTIPEDVPSSLDKTFHRLGSDPSKEAIFNTFVVDYIFAQPPYKVSDVHLEFGISDHAAVIGTVSKVV